MFSRHSCACVLETGYGVRCSMTWSCYQSVAGSSPLPVANELVLPRQKV